MKSGDREWGTLNVHCARATNVEWLRPVNIRLRRSDAMSNKPTSDAKMAAGNGGTADEDREGAAAKYHAMQLPVFHGTRRSSAEAIMRNGFQATSVADQISAVALRYDVSLSELRSHLQRMKRFADLDDRLGTVSLTADPERAGRWANRAPEATWEALWSVFALRHQELRDSYYQSGEGHYWVKAQMMFDPPVILTATAPIATLR